MKELITCLMCLLALVAADPTCSCHSVVENNSWLWGDNIISKWNRVTIGDSVARSCDGAAAVLFENVTTSKITDLLAYCGKQLPILEKPIQHNWIRDSNFGRLVPSPKVAVMRISDTNFTKLIFDNTVTYQTQRIYLKNVPLDAIPKNLNAMQNLVSFVAKEIPLQKFILSQFNGLNKLQRITISNSLTSITIGAVDLPALLSLNFHSNQIEKVPRDISTLKSLEMLNFCFNKITHLDMSVFNGLDFLQDLKISHNPLLIINSPTTVNLPALQHLHLQHSHLERLDVALWHMPKLASMNLNWNNLTQVANLEGQFPKGAIVYAAGNTWNCTWLNEAATVVVIDQQDRPRCKNLA
ncbi:decorin-like [Culex pipiens pallens]|uniref:decorin-like n=1 Tax=Culex pipiens pallens TaxID=42434 RepID=UPI0022AA452B|nr:decorin-like [Culex pipiens pallens]